MSDGGEVWISPFYFFRVVGSMRQQAGLTDQAALTVPSVYHAGGRSYLEALTIAVDESRTMMAANLELAGRALLLAGTEVTTADMVEEGYGHIEETTGPYEGQVDSQEEWEQQVEDQRQFHDDFGEYMDDFVWPED